MDMKATERVNAGGKDTGGVEDGPDSADRDRRGKRMCMTQESTAPGHDTTQSRKIKHLAYTTLVRPILEYDSIIWDPHTDSNGPQT